MRQAQLVVFASSDLTDEVELLRDRVLPRLHTMLARRSIALRTSIGADDGEDPAGEQLADELAPIGRPGTFVLVLLGGRYGAPLDPLPPAVEAAYWALAPYAGRSRLELICRHALATTGPAPLFVFRDPARRPAAGDAHPQAFGRLVLLKRLVREYGGVLLADADVAPTHPLTGLGPDWADELAEVVLAGLWDAIVSRESELPEPTPPVDLAEPEPALPVYLDENVQFTVYRAKALRPAEWYPLLAFAHLAERRPDAPAGTPDPLVEVADQAARLLGDRLRDYDSPRADSRAAVPRDGEITFLPDVAGVQFNPPRQTFRWTEDVHRADFRMRADPQLSGRTVRGRVSVYLGALILAEIDLAFRVDAGAGPATVATATEAVDHARPYRKIFASYSHRDTEIVRQFELLARSLGDRYLRDVVHLRAGDDWDQGLLRLIEQADVFQLFWSSHSMVSPHVRREWEYAMSLGRSHFIRPTYWEDPLPTTYDPVLPPDSLRRLHFHQIGTGPGENRAIPAGHLHPAVPPPPASTAFAAERAPTAAAAPAAPPGPAAPPLPAAPPGTTAPQGPTALRSAPPRRSRLRTLITPLALTVVAGTALTGVLAQQAVGPLISGGGAPATTQAAGTPTRPGVNTPSEPTLKPTDQPTDDPSSSSSGGPEPTESTSGVGAMPYRMRVHGAERITGPGESKPGSVSTLYRMPAGQSITVSVTFVNTGADPVEVSIYAALTCFDAGGQRVTATIPPEAVVVPVDSARPPGREPVSTWQSGTVIVPDTCVATTARSVADGAVYVEATSPQSPGGTQIVAGFELA